MMQLFDQTSFECSKLITENYSTSFTLGIKTLAKRFRMPVFGIYGFVRFADEIVDTFHDHDKAALLAEFKAETYKAIEQKISLNPVLHAFQRVVHEYHIEHELIEAFLQSMEMDLQQTEHDAASYQNYIFGSAEVVGLMCLRVFTEGSSELFDLLKEPACRLGAAFQKVNFLRDVQADYLERGRTYFPTVDFKIFSAEQKQLIEDDISSDFDAALQGILNLPSGAKAGVYLAYAYYIQLFKKIKSLPVSKIMNERVRVPDRQKLALLTSTYFKHKFSLL